MIGTKVEEPEPESQFLKRAKQELLEVEASLLDLAAMPTDRELIDLVYRRMHGIAGAATMLDYQIISHEAWEMVPLLEEALEGKHQLNEQTIQTFRQTILYLQRVVDTGGNDIDA